MLRKIAVVLSIYLHIANFDSVKAQSICSVTGIENLNWIYKSQVSVFDNHNGIVETFSMLNIDNAYMENSTYLSASIQDDKIIISTTPEFQEIENHLTEIPISATLVTVCAEQENKLEYILELKDTNNHEPKFEKDVYEYIFYDIIPDSDDFNLNEFQEIAAVDLDFTNKLISFDIENNDYLEFKDNDGVQDPGNFRRFIATLGAKKLILAPFDQSFTITATDSAEPSLSSTASVHIIVLRSESPNFTQNYYNARATKDRRILMENEEIKLENVTNFEDIRFDISEEYDNFFNLKISDIIELEFSEREDPIELVTKDDPYLYISIYAEGKEPEIYAETVVLLNMEDLLLSDSSDIEELPDEEELKTPTVPAIQVTTVPTEEELPPSHALRGFNYWIDVNRTYIILFSVLTCCGFLIFFFIAMKRRNAYR